MMGRMYNPRWIDDLVTPVIENPAVAMTGSFITVAALPTLVPLHTFPIHIQGGVFCARTETMKKYPYTTNQRWLHGGSDIYQSFQLLNAGCVLHDVPTLKSVWRQHLNSPEQWKYVHDYLKE